jgi:aspartyl/asparaginyl-tRNA synthetase
MAAATSAIPAGPPSTPQSALFTAPGRPRPLARRLAIHNRVVASLRDFFGRRGFHEIPVTAMADHPARIQLEGMIARGFSSVWCESEILPRAGRREPRHLRGFKLMEAACRDLDLDGLTDLQENLLKTVARDMSADLLGGRHVTRLDQMLRVSHPRLTYRDALDLLGRKGWAIPFGEVIHPDAEATLSRFCGNLPFLVTHLPADMKLPLAARDEADPAVTLSAEYVLPYAGITMDGARRDGATTLAGFSLGLGKLLQYLMGVPSIMDTLIDPMDRIARMMETPPTQAPPTAMEGSA